MKTIELSEGVITLEEVLDLADEENIILQTPDGKVFIVAEVDDFEQEVALVRENKELRAFLAERSKETERFTLAQVEEELGL